MEARIIATHWQRSGVLWACVNHWPDDVLGIPWRGRHQSTLEERGEGLEEEKGGRREPGHRYNAQHYRMEGEPRSSMYRVTGTQSYQHVKMDTRMIYTTWWYWYFLITACSCRWPPSWPSRSLIAQVVAMTLIFYPRCSLPFYTQLVTFIELEHREPGTQSSSFPRAKGN